MIGSALLALWVGSIEPTDAAPPEPAPAAELVGEGGEPDREAGQAPPPAPAESEPASEAEPPSEADPAFESDPKSEVTEEEPAALPPRAAAPPTDDAPKAWGGAHHSPLPVAPAPEPAHTLAEGPWRGVGWVGFGLGVSVPVGGTPPARGGVVAAFGEITVGWRIRPYLGLHTGLSSFSHDVAQRTVFEPDGQSFEQLAYGRITAFDLVTVRAFLPRPRRIEPWAEAGGGIGIRRAPFVETREAVGLARFGLGVDFWLAPTFTVSTSASYRLLGIAKTVGHGLRAGADLGIHW